MAYHYEITVGNHTYVPVGMVDTNAKVLWDKGENGLNYRKRLDGGFVLYRSGNEALYDEIMAFTHCVQGFIWVLDQDWTNPPVVVSTFNKRDIEYNVDKCNIVIKPRFYDTNSIDAFIDKDFNIINDNLTIYTITYNENYQFEFRSCEALNVNFAGTTMVYDPVSFTWLGAGTIPPLKASCTGGGTTAGNTMALGWTYYSQENIHTGVASFFDVSTIWFREVKLTPYAIDPNHTTIPPTGTSIFDFEFLEVIVLNGINYNKWVRNVGSLVGENYVNNASQVFWRLTDYYGNNQIRTLTRARKFNDILEYFATQFGCVLSSEFFTNNVNPISLFDLTNIMIEQKSDAIFVGGVESSDPATLGIITFKQLMAQLWAMYQVTWVINDDVLYIEHINYFRFNFSYTQNLVPGLDLTVVYPVCLSGSISYAFEQNIPIRMKFNFMEAWNIDFVGTDIDYSSCLQDGNTETIAAELFTTDIDPTYLDNVASKDGFVLFHCNDANEVISQVGEISGVSSPNAHFSWANLHLYYWTRNSYLPTGDFNGYGGVNFIAPHKYLRKQRPIEFPFCVENFDDIVNQTVRTTMGDGEIEKAEYSFKTGNIKLELSYE